MRRVVWIFAVALIVLGGEQWWGTGPILDKLHLPLGPKQPWSREHFTGGRAGGYRYGFVRYDNFDYEALYWIGPKAPAKDRAAVLRALRSIRPTS